jgi:hypothetical protein
MRVWFSLILIAIITICTALDVHHLKTIRTISDTFINPGIVPPDIINSNGKPPSSFPDTPRKKLVLPDTFHIRG